MIILHFINVLIKRSRKINLYDPDRGQRLRLSQLINGFLFYLAIRVTLFVWNNVNECVLLSFIIIQTEVI